MEAVDTEKRRWAFEGRWGAADSYPIVRYNRYYLEDKPQYLDDPEGEFWFDKRGEGGRLYLRLPGDADPNSVHIEAARPRRGRDERPLPENPRRDGRWAGRGVGQRSVGRYRARTQEARQR